MGVREYQNDAGQKKSYWYEIGSAWPTKSGEGFNVVLHAVPVDGKFSLFPPRAKPESTPEA
jgi:hypothetical protein